MIMLEINHISKSFKRGSKEFVALADVAFRISRGDYVTISGSSGSGKSTLLNVIGGLIRPDSGEIIFKGESIYDQNRKYLDDYRKNNVGFIFQQFHLMPYLTVMDNIRLSCSQKTHYNNIDLFLERCSLASLKDKYPSDLSVGEKQRAAFIRAIVSGPELLLADEPTGNLDPGNSEVLMTLIEEFHNKGGTVVLVSHDPVTTGYSTQNIKLELGRILQDHSPGLRLYDS